MHNFIKKGYNIVFIKIKKLVTPYFQPTDFSSNATLRSFTLISLQQIKYTHFTVSQIYINLVVAIWKPCKG